MRVGIIGAGAMGQRHAASWHEMGVGVAGFVGRSPERVTRLAREYGAPVYAHLDALLSAVDVVDICVPTPLHYDTVLRSAAAGKHVICEKPLARTVAQGREMLRACEAAGVRLLVAHVLRFFPAYAAIKAQVIDSGDIGALTALHLFRRSHPPQAAGENWFLDADTSGGVIMDLMIHDLDYARWLAGEVIRVYAQQVNHHALVTLTHASGAVSHVEASWDYPPTIFWTGVDAAGADGVIHYDSREAVVHTYSRGDGGSFAQAAQPIAAQAENPYTTQMKAFYAALVDNTPLIVSAEDGLAAVQIAEAALRSVATGQAVTLPD